METGSRGGISAAAGYLICKIFLLRSAVKELFLRAYIFIDGKCAEVYYFIMIKSCQIHSVRACFHTGAAVYLSGVSS